MPYNRIEEFYRQTDDHQICLTHLFRELNYIHQVHQSSWAISLKNLFKKAIELHSSAHYDVISTTRTEPVIKESS